MSVTARPSPKPCTSAPPRNSAASPSATRRSDFTEILARIKRGLLLVAALEEKLRQRAKAGRDIVPAQYRHPAPRSDRAGTAGTRARARHTNIVDMPPDQLPTAAQIAAELRRRPLGAVLADICRDLGVRPGDLTQEQWKELHDLILTYGGDPTSVLFAEWHLRLKPLLEARLGKAAPAPADTGAPRTESASPTGPPPVAQAA